MITPEQLELVTAYVDGEATPEERALVAADADLMAEADRQRALRSMLRDVEAPSAEARDAAVGAALAVFDDRIDPSARPGPSMGTERDVTAPGNIVPLDRRRRLHRMQGLGAAAAVVLVIGGAVIATRNGNGDDSSSAEDQFVAATAASDRETGTVIAQTAAPPTTAMSDAMVVAPATDEPQPTTATGGVEAASEAEVGDLAATAATVTTPAAADVAAPAAPAPLTTSVAPDADPAGVVVIRTADQLAALAADLEPDPPAADDVLGACEDRTLSADADFRDDDGSRRPVAVVVVDADTVGALGLDDCEILLETDR